MIFTKAQVNQILRGEKTQVRVSEKPSLRLADTFPVTIRRGEQVDDLAATPCHVKVTAVYEQTVGQVTAAEANAEGHKSLADFREVYVNPELAVWAVTFEVVELPLYMHRNPGQGRQDYTTDHRMAMKDEAPYVAPSPAELEQMAGVNWEEYQQQRRRDQLRREKKSLEEYLRETLDRVRRTGADAASDLRVVRARLDKINGRIDRAA